jgi:hypothetical protein
LKLRRCMRYVCSPFHIPWLNPLISLSWEQKLFASSYWLFSDPNILLSIPSPNTLIKCYVAAIQFHIYGEENALISFKVTVPNFSHLIALLDLLNSSRQVLGYNNKTDHNNYPPWNCIPIHHLPSCFHSTLRSYTTYTLDKPYLNSRRLSAQRSIGYFNKQKTREASTYKRNIEARSCNHCCSGKVIRITHPEFVFVALGIQQAMRMSQIVICSLPGSVIFFHITS